MESFSSSLRSMNMSGGNTTHSSNTFPVPTSNKDIKEYDLSQALFMGHLLESKEKDSKIAKRNRCIVKMFSLPVSQVNQVVFTKSLKTGLSIEEKNQIYFIPETEEPIEDNYGRCSYFYAKIGKQKVPVYQPGTVMFETAVYENSEIEIIKDGKQQNGAILGNEGALFLAKFMSQLILKYDSLHPKSKEIDCQYLKQALEQILLQTCIEDMKNYGQLLLLKEMLIKKLDQETLNIKHLALFQLKDVCCNDKFIEHSMKESITNYRISTDDAVQAMKCRQSNMMFPAAKMIQEGSENIDNYIEIIKMAMLKQSGIVDEKNQEDFNYFLGNCMNAQVIEQLGVDINPYERSVFRLQSTKSKGPEYYKKRMYRTVMSRESKRRGNTAILEKSQSSDGKKSDGSKKRDKSKKFEADKTTVINNISQGEFLSDDLLYYLQNLNQNEALMEYHQVLREGLSSIFTLAKISLVKSKTGSSLSSLQQASQLIPEVGIILKTQELNQNGINDKLQQISVLIRDETKGLLSKYIAAMLTVKRRFYLQAITSADFKSQYQDFQEIQNMFNNDSLYNLKAQIDLKILEANIIIMDPKDLQTKSMDDNFTEVLADRIVKSFMGDIKTKEISAPLKHLEQPPKFIILKKFATVDSMFNHPDYPLPPMLKKLASESIDKHEQRVRRYLSICDNDTFSNVSQIIDHSVEQQGFLKMYNEVTELRISIRQQNNNEEDKLKCIVF